MFNKFEINTLKALFLKIRWILKKVGVRNAKNTLQKSDKSTYKKLDHKRCKTSWVYNSFAWMLIIMRTKIPSALMTREQNSRKMKLSPRSKRTNLVK